MLSGSWADGRRVFALGVAGLVPAALLTLLLVHQPSVGGRRLYPMLRGSLTVAGLALALVTFVVWASGANRFNRATLSGLGWAGVTVVLCIGPFLESRPRARLYALDLSTGDVEWTESGVTAPLLVNGAVVVTDTDTGELVGLDPVSGREIWRRLAAGALTETLPLVDGDLGNRLEIVDGGIEGPGQSARWTLSLPGETVGDVAWSGEDAYAYVSTPGAAGGDGGAIVKFDVDDGELRWRTALPASVIADGGSPAIGAGGDAIVVAGGERIAALAADDGGRILWSQSVVSLGKSRGYAQPGSVQQVIVTESMVFLSATPPG